MINTSLDKLFYASTRSSTKIHVARKLIQESLFSVADPEIIPICGTQNRDMKALSKIPNLVDLKNKVTCQKCLRRFYVSK